MAGEKLLGIDVGGTKVAFALGDASGQVLARHRRALHPSGRAAVDLERLVRDALAFVESAGSSAGELAKVGVSLPGPVDSAGGRVLYPPNLPGWEVVAVEAPLQAAFGCPVQLENDATAAACAEWRFGAGRGVEHLIYLTMSTGVGGGLILGGVPHRGLLSCAGEIGHLAVDDEGERCACGRRGCLETFVGGAAWTRRLRKRTPPESHVGRLAGDRARVLPEHVLEAARVGDAFARAELDRYNEYLARGIAQLVFVLAPELVVLGTIPTAAGEELCFAPVREKVRERIWPVLADRLRIEPSFLAEDLPYLAGLCATAYGAFGGTPPTKP